MRVQNFKLGDDKWAEYDFRTTYMMGWQDIIFTAMAVYEYLEHPEVLVAGGVGSDFKLADVESGLDMINLKEGGALEIRGLNKIYDNAPFQFRFFNQTDVVRVYTPNEYITSLKDKDGNTLDETGLLHTLDRYMDSIEINGSNKLVVNIRVTEAVNDLVSALTMKENFVEERVYRNPRINNAAVNLTALCNDIVANWKIVNNTAKTGGVEAARNAVNVLSGNSPVEKAKKVIQRLNDGELFFIPFVYSDDREGQEYDNGIHYTEYATKGMQNNDNIKYHVDENKVMKIRFIKDRETQEEFLPLFTTVTGLREVFPSTEGRICKAGKDVVEKFAHECKGIILDLDRPIYNNFLIANGLNISALTADDEIILDYLMNKCKMSEKQAKENLGKLRRHEDIYTELVYYISHNDFKENPICIEGYSAEQLYKTTRLEIIGAYNYLIYLREKPEEALRDLNAGLPVK